MPHMQNGCAACKAGKPKGEVVMDSGHNGHRERLDKKTEVLGFEALEEHEQLERFLYSIIKRNDTNTIAHKLLDKFGSLYGVLTAPLAELEMIEGVGNRTAQILHDFYSFMGSAERSRLRNNDTFPVFNTVDDIGRYAKTLFYDKLTECVYMISLDRRYRAYRFNRLASGDNSAALFYISEAVKIALRNNAVSVVITHNHPSGALAPSDADVDTTVKLYKALKTVEINLVDHILVGRGEYVSFRQAGFL